MARGVEEVPASVDDQAVAAIGRVGLSVAIGCSSYEVPEQYAEPAREFIRLLAKNGHSVVWGGSDVGLMHVVASTAQQEGARIVGVTEDYFQKYAHKSADEMIVVKSLAARKAELFKRSDALAILIGGTGTLDEITEAIENKKMGQYNKPLVVLDTNNFYEGYRLQMQRMFDEKMMKASVRDLVYFADTPHDAMAYITEHAQPRPTSSDIMES